MTSRRCGDSTSPAASPPKENKIPRTLAQQVCDHCIQGEATDRSARSLLGAMLMWGRLPGPSLCRESRRSRRRCGIAFRARPRVSLPAKEPALRRSARIRRSCLLCRQTRDQQKCSTPTRFSESCAVVAMVSANSRITSAACGSVQTEILIIGIREQVVYRVTAMHHVAFQLTGPDIA